jgi:SAM-dependent methyltransferase
MVSPLAGEQEVPGIEHQSYDPVYFKRLAAIEDEHFWFRSRNVAITEVVRSLITGWPPGYKVLEVGCGTGNVLRALERTCVDGTVVGMDLFNEGLAFARQRVSCSLVLGDIENPPFLAQFNLIGAFDVIEHIPDDIGVLRRLQAMMAPGGRLLVTVPAHQSLWSYFDTAAHHCRRYEPSELRQKLSQTGYEVEFLSPFMASTYPLIWAGRRVARALARDRHPSEGNTDQDLALKELRIIPFINPMLAFLLTQEARLIARRRTLPMGSSLIVIAKKV